MTLKNNRGHLLSYFKLCASFHSHLSIRNGVTVWKSQIRVKISDFFVPCDLEIWRMTLKNNTAPLLCSFKLCVSFHCLNSVKTKWSYSPETPNLCQNRRFFVPCDLEIWQMTLKNNQAPLLCYFKLSASFHSHLWIQNGITVRNRWIWVKIGNFLSRVTSKFGGWPWNTIGHLFYVISSFAHHLIAICKFKMEFQSGNAKFGWKSAIFCPVWPWNLTDDLENNRAPLLCYIKLCASFHSHPWIQTGVTVRKRLS